MIFFCLLALPLVTCQTVWPKPQQMDTNHDVWLIDPNNFEFIIDPDAADCSIVNQALQRYSSLLFDRRCPGNKENGDTRRPATDTLPYSLLPSLSLSVQECEEFPYENMDESYAIRITSQEASLSCKSSWGVIRVLETLSQIIFPAKEVSSSLAGLFIVNHTVIIDFPRFPYRGVMIDTARHFIPVAILKQNLEAMAFNKMNVFHWHIVDDQSFPYQSIKFPVLHEQGSYDAVTHVYSQKDVQDIIEFARLRGIRVIPEFDTPGHTLSWKAIPGLLTQCYKQLTGVLGPMNPIARSTYDFLKVFFREVALVFPDSDMHLGGDEVNFTCWDSNPKIRAFMAERGIVQSYQLQQMFEEKLMGITEDLGKNHIVWEEVYDRGSPLSSSSTVHVWLGYDSAEVWSAKLKEITGKGVRAILSSPWYLNYIHYDPDWATFYRVEPLSFEASPSQQRLVIGGSVCMWSEFVDGGEIIARTWPRASAVAERLWSSRKTLDVATAAKRIHKMQCLMQQRGIRVGVIHGPGFCACDQTFV